MTINGACTTYVSLNVSGLSLSLCTQNQVWRQIEIYTSYPNNVVSYVEHIFPDTEGINKVALKLRRN